MSNNFQLSIPIVSEKVLSCDEYLSPKKFSKSTNHPLNGNIGLPNKFVTPIQEKISPSSTKKLCNCKNSKCLKLYCECFSIGEYCSPGCNCYNCCNKKQWEYLRRESIQSILVRNPNAFRSKIQTPINQKSIEPQSSSSKHSKGCCCRKSNCLKKYCECYNATIFCSELCKCSECKNFEGSVERRLTVISDLRNKELESSNDNQLFISKLSYFNIPSIDYKKYFRSQEAPSSPFSNNSLLSSLGLSKRTQEDFEFLKSDRQKIDFDSFKSVTKDFKTEVLEKLKISDFITSGIKILDFDTSKEEKESLLIMKFKEIWLNHGKII